MVTASSALSDSVQANTAPYFSREASPISKAALKALAAASLQGAPGTPIYTVDDLTRFIQEIQKIIRLGLTDNEEAKTQLSAHYKTLEERPHNDALALLLRAKCHRAMAYLVCDCQKEESISKAHTTLVWAHDEMPSDHKKVMLDEILQEYSHLFQIAKSIDPKLKNFSQIQIVAERYSEEARLLFPKGTKITDGNGWFRNAVYFALGLVAVVASVKLAMYWLQLRNKG